MFRNLEIGIFCFTPTDYMIQFSDIPYFKQGNILQGKAQLALTNWKNQISLEIKGKMAEQP